MRLALIDFLLSKTDEEKGSNFLPSILYAIIAAVMPPVVHNNELGSAFVSTTDTWNVRDQHGRLIADYIDEDIDHAALASLPQAQLDAVLTRAAQALEFIIARHAAAAQDGYWDGVAEAERQEYLAFVSQHLPDQQQKLAKIKEIQANTDAEQRKAATIEFLSSYVAGHE